VLIPSNGRRTNQPRGAAIPRDVPRSRLASDASSQEVAASRRRRRQDGEGDLCRSPFQTAGDCRRPWRRAGVPLPLSVVAARLEVPPPPVVVVVVVVREAGVGVLLATAQGVLHGARRGRRTAADDSARRSHLHADLCPAHVQRPPGSISDLFSCIADSLFNKLTYLVIYYYRGPRCRNMSGLGLP